MTRTLFGNAGKSGARAETTRATMDKNINREVNERIRDYAGSPRPSGGKQSVTNYARGIKTGGKNDSDVRSASKIMKGNPTLDAPMGPGERYSAIPTTVPTYQGRPKALER